MADETKKIHLTDEQQKAIVVRDGVTVDRVVIAMAGSGKTTVLVQYYIELLKSGLKPSEIVAITFTDKAARSMKLKLIRELVSMKQDSTARELYAAPISTIHSFCANLVREHALVLGLDPDFDILDEIHSSILLENSLREIMSRWREERPDDYELIALSLDWGGNAYDSFQSFYAEFRSRGIHIDDLRCDMNEDYFFVSEKTQLMTALDDFIDALKNKSKALTASETTKLESAFELKEFIKDLEYEKITSEDAVTINGYTSGSKISGRFSAEIKEIGDDLREQIEYFAAKIIYHTQSDLRAAFLSLMRDVENEYQKSKQRETALDFDDLQDYAVKLLTEFPDFTAKIKQRVKAVLIDEFQDTNPLQMTLAELFRPKNAFFAVGDPRQSIYGFRHADVRIMLDEMQRCRDGGGEVVHLGANFRSRKGVLDAVNGVFSSVPIAPAYPDETFGMTNAGRAFQSKSDESPVELIICEGENIDESRSYETVAIANKILDLLEGGMTVEERGNQTRPLEPGDICILFRKQSQVLSYSRALEAVGVPNNIVSGRGFHYQREVMDLINFLELIQDPYEPLFLSEVIRAPFVGISAQGLYNIINAIKTSSRDRVIRFDQPFWECGEIDLSDYDESRWLSFITRFKDLLEQYSQLGPMDRLNAIVNAFHFRGAVGKGLGGKRKVANIGKLIDFAEDWDRNFPGDNFGFIERMKELRFRDVREGESPISSTENSVKLATIHSAKGLEFPVVILADMASKSKTTSGGILLTPNMEILVKKKIRAQKDDKIPNDCYYESEIERRRAFDKEEENRVLYVAMTRAMEKLIISFAMMKKNMGGFYNTLDTPFSLSMIRNKRPEVFKLNGLKIPVSYPKSLFNHGRFWKDRPKPRDFDMDLSIDLVQKGLPKFSKLRTFYPVTSIASWIRCPRRMRYSEETGLRALEHDVRWDVGNIEIEEGDFEASIVEKDSISATERGSIIHELIYEKLMSKEEFSLDDFIKRNKISAISKKELDEILNAFLGSECGLSIIQSDNFYLEKSFVFKIPSFDPIFRAKPDAVWEKDGEMFIVDFKSGSVHDESDSMGKSYAFQIRLYAQAMKAIFGRDVARASLFYIDASVDKPVELSQKAMDDNLEIVSKFIDSIENDHFPPIVNPGCDYCHYKQGCPAFDS